VFFVEICNQYAFVSKKRHIFAAENKSVFFMKVKLNKKQIQSIVDAPRKALDAKVKAIAPQWVNNRYSPRYCSTLALPLLYLWSTSGLPLTQSKSITMV
jgi:hypothetical protein